jgi:putative two-component system response regulator
MPGVTGLDILRAVRATDETKHLPVLILTAASDAEVKRRAVDLGATDFLPKPVDPHELLPRVRNSLLAKAYQDQLARENCRLEEEVKRRTTELAASREEVVHCLARAAEYRDDDTGEHVMRVGRYVGVIARELGFDEPQVEVLELAAQLHDLGKIAIPDSILRSPGKLEPQQFEVMKKHCGVAKNILQPMDEEQWKTLRSHTRLGAGLLHVRSSPLLMLAAKIAQTHHERWDGCGYPLGLAGEDIPIEGRMTAVADVYDALSSKRPYKPPFPREKCFAILEEGRGAHFDPKVLDAFFARTEDIINIQIQYMDVDA